MGRHILVIGGGAAGFFGAIACAVDPNAQSCQGQAIPQSAAEAILRQLLLAVELGSELDTPNLQRDRERTL